MECYDVNACDIFRASLLALPDEDRKEYILKVYDIVGLNGLTILLLGSDVALDIALKAYGFNKE